MVSFDNPIATVSVVLPKPPSLNSTYEQKHWSSRKKSTDKNRGLYKLLLLEQGEPKGLKDAKYYSVEVKANARLDVDNRVMVVKYLNDCLERDLGWILNDSPKYFKRMLIEQDDDMDKDVFVATISFHG